ncbi:hypothetical protein [Brevibacillus brevis]|uniref:hypothetical protein n=1 Tax=Brevibacillus brevis TaxID=1393 RepID=UPI0025A63818|nr:hypothetical protein [Brevibacillus brevis]WJQ82278.1 hypothetical protein QN310_03790 [Brevibacillus brevis]
MATIGDQLAAPEAGWKRYDNTYPSIAYNGTWAKRTGYAGSYELTDTYTSTAGDTATFDFVGTKIRIISFFWNNFTADAKITIDGVAYTFSERSAANTPKVIVFEKMGLSEGKHRVELKLNSGTDYLGIDAIDIDDTGSIEFPIGGQLTAPAQGWKRYDDGNPSIKYFGTFVRESNQSFYGGASNYATSADFKIKFNFIGTKIRIIGNMYQNKFPNVPITIDGTTETFSQYGDLKFQALQYEKIGLENKMHTVEITVPSYTGSIGFDPNNVNVKNIQIDAIDIDADGRILHPDEVVDVKDLIVGKRIRFNYLATAGTFGTISIGKEMSGLLPNAPATSANGDGYFIMYGTNHKGDKLLMADRNIQTISWDALNTAGIASGSGLPIKNLHTIPGLSEYSSAVCKVSASTEYDTANYHAWKAFDGSETTYWTSTAATETTEEIVKIEYSSPTKITSYYLYAIYSPKKWFFEASNDGTSWDILHNGNEVSSWHGLKKTFSFKNDKAYTQYRIRVSERYVWNGLYYVGFYTAQLFTSSDREITLRLPTGGVNASDKDNEWDKYITDDQIWNNVNHGSWTSTTDQSNSKARVIRGYNGLKNWTSGSTDLTTPGRGFRPALLIESFNNNRFLILDGTDVKTYTPSGWETVGAAPPTDDMFQNKGMLDLSTCTPYLKDLTEKSNLKILVSKPKREPTVAHLTGVPVPKIIKMKNDVSFLNTSKINSLTLSGTEKGVLRIAISTDSGTTWEAKQKNGSWTKVDVTNIIDFKAKAMTIDDFNSISEWDEKIDQARNLRCAFYFEQSSSTDETSLDSLTMDVDLLDSWDMAMPGVDYKYGYNRNINLRVLLFSDGDYKINVGSGGSSGSPITEVDGGTF